MIYCSGESTSVTSSIGAGDVVVEGHRDRVVVPRSGCREQFRWRPVARSEAETTGGVGVAVAQPSATETYAGAWLSPYRAVSHAPAVLRRAWRVVASSVTDDVALEGRELLAALEDGLRQFNDCADYLPRLSAAVTDDGSLLFEWAFPEYRIGFNIEQDHRESGWFLVTKPSLGGIAASGFLNGADLQPLALWLLGFVVMHI